LRGGLAGALVQLEELVLWENHPEGFQVRIMAPFSPTASVVGSDDFPDLFEGPEKTLTLCFKSRRVAGHSLRLVPQEAWSEILKHAKCEILSVVDSTPVVLAPKSKDKVIVTKGVTAYLLSESSLFVTDYSVVLKTCGRTTPLMALEPILDLAVPSWRTKDPEHYLKYATFMRLGYMRPDEQLEPHTSWVQEVQHMDKYFKGEAVVLGSEATSMQHVYVANHLPKDEIIDHFSTQVALTNLDTTESMRRFGNAVNRKTEDEFPLKNMWKDLHGDEKRHPANNAKLDECFFKPIGYSANGVFGRNYTTVHITPQPGCSYLSVETSMPMNREARQRFAEGAGKWCSSDTMAVTEFALSSKLFTGAAPEVPGFELRRSTQTAGQAFACAHHHYERASGLTAATPSSALSTPQPSPMLRPAPAPASPPLVLRQPDSRPEAILAEELAGRQAATVAAERVLAQPGEFDVDSPIVLLDTTILRRQVDRWFRLLPRVEPFYAVKCNPNPALVKALWEMWQERKIGGFDCASPSEMGVVSSLEGIDMGDRIVYANPCKQPSAVSFARGIGIRWLVFDNAAELEKLAGLYPTAELLLRVQTDDSKAQCPLSNKFGCAPEDCASLLERAQELGLQVVGVSFHVGSGCSELGAFRGALQRARVVFDEAARRGFCFKLLDIGGGFPGMDEEGCATFDDHAADISSMLEDLFPDPSVRVIAEPGRYFVAAAQALMTTVVSMAESSKGSRYYLNDGLYGSFNCVLFDHQVVTRPTILRDGCEISMDQAGALGTCTVFGPTCDGFDMITDSMELPRLRGGDRLLFHNMGAYTTAASTCFNGFSPAKCFVFESQMLGPRSGAKLL